MHKTKKEIINSALQLFAKKGYEKTTIEEIIQATGLSKGGVYHHFKSKEAISDAIIQLYFDSVQEYYNTHISKDSTPLEKLDVLLRSKYFVMQEDNLGVGEVFLNPKQITIRSKVQKLNRKYFSLVLNDILSEGKKSGDFKLDTTEVAAHLIFALQEAFLSISREVLKNQKKIQPYRNEVNRLMAFLVGIDQKQLPNKP